MPVSNSPKGGVTAPIEDADNEVVASSVVAERMETEATQNVSSHASPKYSLTVIFVMSVFLIEH